MGSRAAVWADRHRKGKVSGDGAQGGKGRQAGMLERRVVLRRLVGASVATGPR